MAMAMAMAMVASTLRAFFLLGLGPLALLALLALALAPSPLAAAYPASHIRGLRPPPFRPGDASEHEAAPAPPLRLRDDDDGRREGERERRFRARAPPNMIPLSRPPLLLLTSSAPIASREGCSLLSDYFDGLLDGGDDDATDGRTRSAAEGLLRDVADVVDEVTNCPRHDGEAPVPRYVRYEPTVVDVDVDAAEGWDEILLPDGLHVDTNNGKLFRHVTAILYLTDDSGGPEGGGGTTFPLAVPRGGVGGRDPREDDRLGELRGAARRLLDRGVHHTKADVGAGDEEDGRVLEDAAVDLFRRDARRRRPGRRRTSPDERGDGAAAFGARVAPEAGKLIYFHNVGDDGTPDRASFHGGEELIASSREGGGRGVDRGAFPNVDRATSRNGLAAARTKSILVFFKEVPIESFRQRGREGFAEEVRRARSWTKEWYY
ncbi:hypothetical protein ACHAWF_012815 [Thalassiosira exigua]